MLSFLLTMLLLLFTATVGEGERAEEERYELGEQRTLAAIEKEILAAEAAGRFEPPVPPAEAAEDLIEQLEELLASETGEGTYYGGRFHGRRTASGERFDQNDLTAAHRTFPFGTRVRVTNLRNGRSVVVRINDRGPFGPARVAERKVIDVSHAAARELGFLRQGRVLVRVDVLEWGG
jgi:rare lipoprotein A